MASFLRYLGATDAIGRGAAQIADTAINLRQLQNQEAAGRMAAQAQGLNIMSAQIDLKKKMDEERMLDTPMRLEDALGNMPEESKQFLTKFGVENGLVTNDGGVFNITPRRLQQGKKLIDMQQETKGTVYDLTIQGLNRQMSEMKLKLMKKPDDQELAGQYKAISQQYSDIVRERQGLPGAPKPIQLSTGETASVGGVTVGAGSPAKPDKTNTINGTMTDEKTGQPLSVTLIEDPPHSGRFKVLTAGGKDVSGKKKSLIELGQSGLQKRTLGDLEEGIVSAQNRIDKLGEVSSLFKPEYLTYEGKLKGGGQALMEKLGGTAGQEQFLADRTQFFNIAQTAFLEHRKWITGVAGSVAELNQIAKSFPNPEKNSPTQFASNLKETMKTTRKLKARLELFRSLGIEKPTKEQLSKYPLNSIPDPTEAPKQAPQAPGLSDIPTEELMKMLEEAE